jgi:hypothetical protein
MRDGDFEVLPAGEMRAKYGLTAENRPIIRLDLAKVPVALRHLIPLAEQFGIGDDLIREDVVAKTPPLEVEAMRRAVEAHADAFDEWLAGPEAEGPKFSDEYIAFSCLRMAADGC